MIETESIHCDIWAETEKQVELQAYNIAQHNQMTALHQMK
jgi:hypothetical protein